MSEVRAVIQERRGTKLKTQNSKLKTKNYELITFAD